MNRLKQLGLATHNYEAAKHYLPPGSESRYYDRSHAEWAVSLVGAGASVAVYGTVGCARDAGYVGAPVRPWLFQCFRKTRRAWRWWCGIFCARAMGGAAPSKIFGPTNYAACAGSGAGGGTPFQADGLFFINSQNSHEPDQQWLEQDRGDVGKHVGHQNAGWIESFASRSTI